MRRNKMASMAAVTLAVTAFAACSDDDTDSPTDDGGTEVPMDTSAITVASTPTS